MAADETAREAGGAGNLPANPAPTTSAPASPTLKVPAAGVTATVRVPGTSANLGPGFDSLGLAVSLYDTLHVTTLPAGEQGSAGDQASPAGQPLEFDLHGEGVEELPRDASHLVVKAMDLSFARLGYRRGGLRIAAENVLPHGRGLGSSASAIVAAVIAANALVDAADRQDAAWVLQLASEMEGHPDNVAPAIFGAASISWHDGGTFASVKVVPSPRVVPVVAIPDYEVKTELARRLLPATVPHADAAANAGRAALLIHALKDAPELLKAGTTDYLHQDYRRAAMEPSADLVARLRSQGHAAFISGAGPTVMVLADGAQEAAAVVHAIESGHSIESVHSIDTGENGAENGVAWRVYRLSVDLEGAKVEVHPGSQAR